MLYIGPKHSESDHHIDCEHPEIIGYANMKIRLQNEEILQISKYSANKSLNVNIDSFETLCKLW